MPREHDTGIDLLAIVRDERLFDLNLILAVQVKTGDDYFTSPRRDEHGEVDGWWFADGGRKHVDDWLDHVLPFVVVLHNHRTRKSYWAHVTHGTVVSTGKGAKIFVPRKNVLDDAHRDQLVAIATTARTAPEWEGSVLGNIERIPPRDRLRYALLAPRLVAPHRNKGLDGSATVEQVVALLVEGRMHDVDRLTKSAPGFVKLEQAAESEDWRWRFVGALHRRLTTGAVEGLVAIANTGPTPEARAASTVAAAAALIEASRSEEAIELIESNLSADDNRPVDHAWLLVQRARAELDVGRIDEARESAASALSGGQNHSQDVTARAITGAAAMALFSSEAWKPNSLDEILSSLDNVAAWWRTQRESSGSAAVINREFKRWTQARSIDFEMEDEANNRLVTASVLASFAGDHRAWRTLESRNAKQALVKVDRATSIDTVHNLLDVLRLAGDHQALGVAVRRLVDDGPSAAVTACAAGIDFANWSATSSQATLKLLRQGGDVLDAATARAAVRWLLATLTDPVAFIARTRPAYRVTLELIDTLAGVVPAVSVDDGRAVVDFFLQQVPTLDEAVVQPWARVLLALPGEVWNAQLLTSVVESVRDHEDLHLLVLGLAAERGDAAFRARLLEMSRAGSLQATWMLSDADELPADVAEQHIAGLATGVARIVADARRGERSIGGPNLGQALVLLNVHHPGQARWDEVCALLEEPAVSPADKNAACSLLIKNAAALPHLVRARLAVIAGRMVDHPVTLVDRFERTESRLGPAAALAVHLGADSDQATSLLNRALASPPDRVWVPMLSLGLPSSQAAGVLAVLAQDLQVRVRASAASCAVKLLESGQGDAVWHTVRQCAADPGVDVRRMVATGLSQVKRPNRELSALLAELSVDSSARVRAAARSIDV